MEILNNLKLDFIVTKNDPQYIRELVKLSAVFNSVEIDIAGELAEAALNGTDTSYQFIFLRDSVGRIVAYSCYGEIPLTDRRYDLYWIVVSPDYQNQGLAKIILAHTISKVREAQGVIIYAETSGIKSYAPARSFYMKNGFKQVAIYPNFYRNNDDKVVFSYNI